MRRYENAGPWQASRQGTRRKTRRTNETRNETGTTPPARIDSGVVAISFFMRRSHQLIHIIRRPVFSSRLSFRSAPQSLAPPGSPVPRPVLRPVATPRFSSRHLVISSSHPVISFAYRFLSSYRIGLVPFTAAKRRRWWRATGTEAGGFFSCAVFLSSLSFAPSSGSPHRGRRPIVVVSTVVVSTTAPHHLIRFISLIPHCRRLITERGEGSGVRHL